MAKIKKEYCGICGEDYNVDLLDGQEYDQAKAYYAGHMETEKHLINRKRMGL